jgi:hypothetical protein
LEHAFPREYDSLMGTIGGMSIPLRPVGEFRESGRPLSPKRHMRQLAGRRLPFLLPVNQAGLNRELDRSLRSQGWTSQPIASGSMVGDETPLGLRGDFFREGVFVEVEFGNIASLYRDLFKFQVANRARTGQVAVLIAATERFARFFDSGITTFEAASRYLPYLAIGIQMPICFIGIEPDSFDDVGQRYEELRALCVENGIECHPFSDALGVEILDPVTGIPPGDSVSGEQAGSEGLTDPVD